MKEKDSSETRRLDERIDNVEVVAKAAEIRSQQILTGFPQEYMTRNDARREMDRVQHAADELRADLIRIRTDHVGTDAFGALERQVSGSNGQRTTLVATFGIIVTVFIVLLGYSINNRITSADVSNQIQTEAPWNRDGPEIKRRLLTLENRVHDQEAQIRELQAQVNAHIVLDRTTGGK